MGFFDRFRKNRNVDELPKEDNILSKEVIEEKTNENHSNEYVECERHLSIILQKLKDIGYHKIKIDEFYKKGLEEIKELKAKGQSDKEIIDWLDLSIYATQKNLMKSDKERLKRHLEYIDSDESMTAEEKEFEKKDIKKMFEHEHGLPVDFDKEVKEIINKLEAVGYQELRLKEFREECKKIIVDCKKNNDSEFDILSKLKYFCDTKCERYKEEEKRLANEITYLKNQQSATDEDIEDAKEDFRLRMGGDFNPQKIIDEFIKQLKEMGYSDSLLKKTEDGIVSKLQEWKSESNNSIKFKIVRYFSSKINAIKRDISLRENDIKSAKEIIGSKSSINYTSIYGRDIIDDRINSQIGIIKTKFKMKYGHDCIDELIKYIEQNLESYGVSKDSCKRMIEEIKKKRGNISAEDIERIQHHYSNENDKYISIFIENMEELSVFAQIYYGTNEDVTKKFIREFLSKIAYDRKNMCIEIDKKYLEFLNNNRNKSNLSSMFDDDKFASDFIKAEVSSMDKLNDQLFDVQNNSVFTTWLRKKEAENNIRDYNSKYGKKF